VAERNDFKGLLGKWDVRGGRERRGEYQSD